MPTTTITPKVRLAALIGVLLIALAGSAFFMLRGHTKTPSTTAPPSTHPTTPTHRTRPTVNPLLPAPLRAVLEQHRIVVVGFFNPDSPIGLRTIAEARAGAALAGVGYFTVDLRHDSVAGPLTALLPSGQMLPNPGIAIYKRPGRIIYRADGFLLRQLIPQAIKDSQ
ncbi:MAG: hypothetical protein QOG85_373 [Gaiellaceae bacterium]|jgi:hypothetical protein|nr:hypothetical protein [Gaiellaceae bacterium]